MALSAPFAVHTIFVMIMMTCGVCGSQAPDNPIVGSSLSYLSSGWVACSSSFCINDAQVPGDIITDLTNNGIVQDVLRDLNFKNDSLWQDNEWTYQTQFALSIEQSWLLSNGGEVLVVLDGVKMGAHVSIDDHLLGDVNDQFLRYTFSLSQLLHNLSFTSSSPTRDKSEFLSPSTIHTLKLHFDQNINVSGRFMAATGGWDWAPYSLPKRITSDTGARTFSFGIWRHVYLVNVLTTSIEYVVPHTFYVGNYPTTALSDGEASFQVKTRVHFYTPASSSSVAGQLTVSVAGLNSSTLSISVPAGRSNFTVEFQVNKVKLWWPNGYGSQYTYPLTVIFTPNSDSISSLSSSSSITSVRSVGFRLISLVTGDDTDPSYVSSASSANGNSYLGMRFRVNGVATYLRGANLIPMEVVEGRNSDEAYIAMLQSAAAAGMNVLRVWGGGIFYSDVTYNTADSLGLLMYHDMQFAQEGHAPSVTATQEAEFRHQIRRLSHHPSIMMWDGCNECSVQLDTPTAIYATFVLATLLQEDVSRIVWPSCPSWGWDSGVNRLTSLPNLEPLVPRVPNDTTYTFEIHGPYQRADGFPTVNGDDAVQLFDPMMPNIFDNTTKVGLQYPSLFVSEFGSVGMSSFESMSATISSSAWALHGGTDPDNCTTGWDRVCTGNNIMAERNYPCDNIIFTYFGQQDLTLVGEKAFRGQLYQCTLAQAFDVKGVIEQYRAQNVYGTIIWQLGEIWPTGGWGSLEYGSVGVEGQVVGGRWKPLHHLLFSSLYRDTFVACGLNANVTSKDTALPVSALSCYVRHDGPSALSNVRVVVSSLSLTDGSESHLLDESVNLAAGAGTIHWFQLNASQLIDVTTSILASTVTHNSNSHHIRTHNELVNVNVAQNYNLLTTPSKLHLSSSSVTASVGILIPIPQQQNGHGNGAQASSAADDVVRKVGATITVSNSGPGVAVYVSLTTQAQGYFSENAFILTPGSRTLYFYFLDRKSVV